MYLYFNINEYLTAGYKLEGSERLLMERLFVGDYAVLFWVAQSLCVFIPAVLMIAVLGIKRYHRYTIPGVVLSSALVIVGAWAKRYIIVVPTLRSPYLPSGQRLPWEWTHYHPTWVEWSITAAAVAGFALIYTLMVKLFPIVSIWETREQPEEVAVSELPDESVPSRWWKPGTVFPILAIAALLLCGRSANAAGPAKPKTPKPTAITVEWKTVPAAQANRESATDDGTPLLPRARVFMYTGRLFTLETSPDHSAEDELKPPPPVAVTATLRDSRGAPISFKPVEFSAKTGLGTLAFGSRPTLADGKAQLVIKDHRYGTYPVQVVFRGDDEYAPATFDVNVDFGARSAPSLPRAGVLITPYATPYIAVPFLLFYGAMWVAFIYAFGYLILWKMRKLSQEAVVAQVKTAPAAQGA